MTHPLEDATAKIERAKKHLLDLKKAEARFLKRSPYVVTHKFDTESSKEFDFVVAEIKARRDVPPTIAVIAGDLIHNLRSSLDYLAFELWRLSPRNRRALAANPKAANHVYFPVCWELPGTQRYESAFAGKVQGITARPVARLRRVQPYQFTRRGKDYRDSALFILHDLDRRDKHQALHLMGGAILDASVTAGSLTGWFGPTLITPEQGTVTIRFGAGTVLLDSNTNVEVKKSFAVAIRDVRPGKYEPVVPLMHQLIDFVESVALDFRSRFFP